MNNPATHWVQLRMMYLIWLLTVPGASAWESTLFGPDWVSPGSGHFYTDKILQDFSFAGYRRGEVPLPPYQAGGDFNILDYGADPSGAVDSTVAIQNAINAAAAAGGGVVWMPAGLFKLSPQGSNAFCLQITASGVVLRGAGAGQTFLLNTQHLMRSRDIIRVTGPSSAAWIQAQTPTQNLTQDLMGPTTELPLDSVNGFAVGDWVMVRADPGDDWATEHLEPGWLGGGFGRLMYPRRVVALNTVTNRMTIDVPIRYALKMRDESRVYRKTTFIFEIGLEDFSIGNVQHPGTTGWAESDYLTEGRSAFDVHASFAIAMRRTVNSWIRGVSTYQPAGNTATCHILNNGILLSEAAACTVRDCYFQRPQFGGGGGAGYMYRLQNSSECLLIGCGAEFSRHGLVISHMASSGNVLHDCLDKTTGKQTGNTGNQNTNGKGSDHHMHFSHSNLLDVCRADGSWFEARYRPFGSVPLHNLTSAHGVFWNTHGQGSAASYVVHSQQSRYGYVIGTRGPLTAVKTDGSSVSKTNPVDHVEGVAQGDTLTPHSLFREQRRRRLALPTINLPQQQELLFPQQEITVQAEILYGDDPILPPDALVHWEQISGPRPALITPAINPTSAQIRCSFPGTYQFRIKTHRPGLDVDDFVAEQQVTILVRPAGWRWLELDAEADAYVQRGQPDATFGGTSIWMKWVNNNSVDREAFMRFNLSALNGKLVQQAFLDLHQIEPTVTAVAVTDFVTDDSWTETGVTWNTRPAVAEALVTWHIDPLQERYVLDVGGRVATEAAGDGLFSMRHRIQSQSNNTPIFKFRSRENPETSKRPKLRVLVSDPSPSFQQWIDTFTDIPPALRGPDADADGDGISNLEEYARRLSPTSADGKGLQLQSSVGGGGQFRLPDGASLRHGAYPILEYSPTLPGNTWQTVEPQQMWLQGENLLWQIPTTYWSGSSGFFRIRYELVED